MEVFFSDSYTNFVPLVCRLHPSKREREQQWSNNDAAGAAATSPFSLHPPTSFFPLLLSPLLPHNNENSSDR